MTMEFRLGNDDGVDGVGSNGACTASCEANLAPVTQARMASAGGCTVGENVPGTSEFAAAPVVADPLLVDPLDTPPAILTRRGSATTVAAANSLVPRIFSPTVHPPADAILDGGTRGER